MTSLLTHFACWDRHYAARRNLVTVDGKELGETVMPAVIPKLSRALGRVRHSGHAIDEDRVCIMSDWLSADSTPPTSLSI
jgi:crotonobetainyl-CoA:carnitine CoA-transferase CaiB-like acyl-CoA transferase